MAYAAATGATVYQDAITLFFSSSIVAGDFDESRWIVTINGVDILATSVERDSRAGATATNQTLRIFLPTTVQETDSRVVSYRPVTGSDGALAFENGDDLYGVEDGLWSMHVYQNLGYGPGAWALIESKTNVIQNVTVWSGQIFDNNTEHHPQLYFWIPAEYPWRSWRWRQWV